MSMTIRDLLSEPHLGLQLIAGHGGLDHQIIWSHTSDLEQLWEWVSDGVLLMTNGMSIPREPDGQVELAHNLAEAGVAGLAIGEKMHAPELTIQFIDACESLSLPVINIPFPLPFIAISRSIAEALLVEESRRIKQTARIYEILRKTSGAEWGWGQLIAGISKEVDAGLHVLDERCLHPWIREDPPIAAATEASVRTIRSDVGQSNRHFQWSTANGRSILLMDIPTHPHALMVIESDSGARPDGVILLHAATIIGLALSSKVLREEGLRRAGEEFMSAHLGSGNRPRKAVRGINEFGLDCNEFFIATAQAEGIGSLGDIDQRLKRHGIDSIAMTSSGFVHALVSGTCHPDLIQHAIGEENALGLSSIISESELVRGLRESQWALNFAQQKGKLFHQYSNGETWFGINGQEEGHALVERLLGPVLDYDLNHDSDLLGTLRSYLDNQRSAQKVADETFTHRQTVIYRLRKISKLTQMDLSETSDLAQLWLAMQMLQALGPAYDLEE